MNQMTKRSVNKSQINDFFRKWFRKHYKTEHTAIGYIGMYGVWDVMGKNEIDQQFFISGRTEHLIQMRDMLDEAIRETVTDREENSG
jgi:hypothetical protein